MKITENKFLTFGHILEAVILAADPKEKEGLRQLKNDYEKMFANELAEARNQTDGVLEKNWDMVRQELRRARKLHPNFADTYADAICVMVEEIGELAQAVNDMQTFERLEHITAARRLAKTEAAQVAVTALRFMEKIG